MPLVDGPTLKSQLLGEHPDGLQFDDCYKLLQRLGSGSFGEVYAVQMKDTSVDNKQYACKVIDRSKLKPGGDETVFRELNILKDIRDLDHVTQLKDCFVTPQVFHIVQTLCRGGDVFDQLAKQTKYTEKDARDLAATLFKVMELLHLRRLAHRDLKPENLLLVNRMCASNIVVADFGMARYVPKDGFLKTRCGTPAFVAPEVVAGRPYNTAVDMWSIGTLLFMLLGGQPPFQDQSFQGLFRKIQAADYDFSAPPWRNVSIPAKQCLASLLRTDPYYRATATQSLQAKWFTDVDETHLSSRDLTSSVRELKTWVAKRRFKSAVHAVKLTTHFSRFVAKDQASLLQKVQAWDKADNNDDDDNNSTLLAQWKGKTQNFDQLYETKEEIGKGQKRMSTVYKCVHKKSKNTYAVKKIPRNVSDIDEQAVLHEVAVLQNLKHPNMVQIVDFLEDDDYYYVILEHVPGKNVMEHLQEQSTFTEEGARAIMGPLLQVVAYIHREGVVHRDVTLENLLMADATEEDAKPTVKLCDFGLARRVRVPRSVIRCCGSPLYMAPEVCKHIPYDQSADMWSVGVLLYMLLIGAPPFTASSETKLFDQIRNGQWGFPADCKVSDAAKELVQKLLVNEPLQRWTAEEALRSKWFQEEAASLSSIDLSKNVNKLKELRSKFKTVAMAVIKMSPRTSLTAGRKSSAASAANKDGLVIDSEGRELGKEVDLESYEKTTESLFEQDPEQKDDDASRVAQTASPTSSVRHVV